jgi:hypothetical protein
VGERAESPGQENPGPVDRVSLRIRCRGMYRRRCQNAQLAHHIRLAWNGWHQVNNHLERQKAGDIPDIRTTGGVKQHPRTGRRTCVLASHEQSNHDVRNFSVTEGATIFVLLVHKGSKHVV